MDEIVSIWQCLLQEREAVMKTPTNPESKNFGEEFSDLMRRHPWYHFFLIFFYMLGAFHLISDLVLLVKPTWHIDSVMIYIVGLSSAATNIWVLRFTKSRKQIDREREAENQILRQADEILKQAQADAKAHQL